MLPCWYPEMVCFFFVFPQFCPLPIHVKIVSSGSCLHLWELDILIQKRFYSQKSSKGLTQVIIDWQVHFLALTRYTIFYSLFMKCLVVWRIWIQRLIIGTGFTEQLLRKNPFFIIFMPNIPLSEVGNRDEIHVCHGHSFICSLWRGLLTALISVGQLKTHSLFRIPSVAPFLSVR